MAATRALTGRVAAALAVATAAVLAVAPSTGAKARPAQPPAGWLAFTVTQRRFHYDIYVVRTNGTGLRRLTFDGNSSGPAWGPGGARILFTRDDHIWIMGAAGRHKHPVDIGPGNSWQASWAPTGKAFAFISDRSGTNQLYMYRFATGTVSQLTTATSPKKGPRVYSPAWSPRGDEILFSRTYGVDGTVDNPIGHIFGITPRGAGLNRLTYHNSSSYVHGGDDQAPNWAPSGTRFIYTRGWQGDYDTPSFTQQFRIQRRNGTIAHKFPSHGDISPAFSPDNRWVAAIRPDCCDFNGGLLPAPGLWLMRADGTSARRIVSYARVQPYYGGLAWKPTPQSR